jgi:hypothetical protein
VCQLLVAAPGVQVGERCDGITANVCGRTACIVGMSAAAAVLCMLVLASEALATHALISCQTKLPAETCSGMQLGPPRNSYSYHYCPLSTVSLGGRVYAWWAVPAIVQILAYISWECRKTPGQQVHSSLGGTPLYAAAVCE